MAVVNTFKSGLEFSMEFFGDALTKDLGDLISTQKSHPQFTGAAEEFPDREGFLEDKVEAIFDLAEGIEAMEVHGLTFPLGELGAKMKGPIIETFLDELWGKAVGSVL